MRTIDVFVRDRFGRALNEAGIAFAIDGRPAISVVNSEGRGRLEVKKRNAMVEAEASYRGATQRAKLGSNQDTFTFTFDADPHGLHVHGHMLRPDLIDAIVVVLIAGAIDIFILSMGTQLIDSPVFQRLPSFITDAYSAVWSSVAAGVAGIGVAILKALTRPTGAQTPNYLVYVPLIAFGGLAMIVALALVAAQLSRSASAPTPSSSEMTLKLPDGAHFFAPLVGTEKTLQLFAYDGPYAAAVDYSLKVTIGVKNGRASGRLESAVFKTTDIFPPEAPTHLTRLEIGACYIKLINGIGLVFSSYPPPSASNARDLDINLEKSNAYELPTFDFSFYLPPDSDLARTWLCVAIRHNQRAFFFSAI